MVSNKNIRLTHEAWMRLRNLKFSIRANAFTEVFELLLGAGTIDLELVKEISDARGESPHSKKTVVISYAVHDKLRDYKIAFMTKYGTTSRGKGATSISDIVVALIQNYEENSLRS